MRKKKKHLDFDLNLIPFIDLLSTCICFLLLTAVWLHVGSLDVKQAVGGTPAHQESGPKPTMWLNMGSDGAVTLHLKDARVPAKLTNFKVAGVEGRPNFEGLAKAFQQIKTAEPALKTALIQPQAASVYEDLIDLMDQVKKSGIPDLGVAPL